MNLEEKTLEKNILFEGRIINLRRDTALLPNGATASREVVEHPGGVCVAALDENDNVLMVRQFRYPYKDVILEVPAGKRDRNGEDPLACGKRELKEETGATAKEYISLGELYPTPGFCDEIIHLFAAKGLDFGETCPDDDEFVEVEKIPLDTAVEMVLNGEIKDAKTQVCILKLKALRERGLF